MPKTSWKLSMVQTNNGIEIFNLRTLREVKVTLGITSFVCLVDFFQFYHKLRIVLQILYLTLRVDDTVRL